MSSPPAAAPEDIQVISVVPILRMHDVAATIRFYVDYLGCSLDSQDGSAAVGWSTGWPGRGLVLIAGPSGRGVEPAGCRS
jgi:hypothetical protein